MSQGPELFGRFQLVERLGVGGMAELFRAELSGPYGFAKTVAIKKILPELNRRQRFREMFLRESRIMSALHHGNLVQVYELGEIDGELFMCLEYVEGCDLAKLLRSQVATGATLPAWLAIWLVREVGRGLAYLHELKDERGEGLSIVHRDVNPHNVLLSVHGAVKLGDFGIAKGLSDELQTRQGQVQGKLEYLSPEQARGDVLGPASDLYSLGLVLFELLSGQRYLQGQTDFELMRAAARPTWRSPRSLNPEISKAQEEVLRRTLRPDPQARYGSATALVAALDELWMGQAKSDPADSLAGLVKGVSAAPLEAGVGQVDGRAPLEDDDPLSMVSAGAAVEHDPVRRTGTLAMEELPPVRSRTLLWVLALAGLVVLGLGAWWLLRPETGVGSTRPTPPPPADAGVRAAADPKPAEPDEVADPQPAPDAGTNPAPVEDTMALVDRLLAEEEADPVIRPDPVDRPPRPRRRRKRKKRPVRKPAPPVADKPTPAKATAWNQAQRGQWRTRWQTLSKQARQRGVRSGDCPACDGFARAFAQAFKAQDEPGAQAALDGYARSLGELRIDGAFMDRKLRRLRTVLQRRGATKANEGKVDAILTEIVDGRLEQANRAINRLLDQFRS